MIEWKKVAGIEYEVSTSGVIRNIKTGHVSLGGNCGGYKALRVKGRPVDKVHRLVALAFIPNPEGKEEINHIDGNKKNNCVSNLEWCSRIENVAHAKNELGVYDKRKNRFKKNEEIEITKLSQVYGLGYKTIGDLYNRSWNSVRAVINRFKDKTEIYSTL